MAFFDFFNKKSNAPENVKSDNLQQIGTKSGFFMPFYGVTDFLTQCSNKDLCLFFNDVPHVQAVLNKDASMFSNMKLEVVDKKTGNEIETQFSKVLDNPNWFQSQGEFLRQTRLHRLIYGNEYLYFIFSRYPEFTQSIKSLNPYFTELKVTSNIPIFKTVEQPNVQYIYLENGTYYDIDSQNIIHLNDNRIRIEDVILDVQSNQTQLNGISKLISLRNQIKNIIAAYETRGFLTENGGAIGIFSNDSTGNTGSTINLDPKKTEQIQENLQQYGRRKGKFHTIVTDLKLRWQQISVNPKDLGLYEEVEDDFMKICDNYGMARELFSTIKGTTFENQRIAEKQTYQNTIIPAAQEWIDALNGKLETESKTWEVKGTFNHLDVFSENKKDKANSIVLLTNALSKAFTDGAITLQQYQNEIQKYGIEKIIKDGK